jgi:hypothetical protein
MKPYLQPMSEEFIYASPEVPGSTSYRLLLAPDVGVLPAVDQLTERGRMMSESERNGHTGVWWRCPPLVFLRICC